MVYIMEIQFAQDQKITKYTIGAEHSAITFKKTRIKKEKNLHVWLVYANY